MFSIGLRHAGVWCSPLLVLVVVELDILLVYIGKSCHVYLWICLCDINPQISEFNYCWIRFILCDFAGRRRHHVVSNRKVADIHVSAYNYFYNCNYIWTGSGLHVMVPMF